MIKLSVHLKFLVLLLMPVLAACSDASYVLHTKEDLNGSYIAVLDESISEKDFGQVFPESRILRFKSDSEFLLALAIGKCDAGIIERKDGEYLLARNAEYESLAYPELVSDSTLVIAHSRILPDDNLMFRDEDLIGKSLDRVYDNIVSNGYWKLILRGLGATLAMFFMGIVMAFILAFLMQGMNTSRYLRYISVPVSYFIRKIHDVPSVVLIFFFYYFVFATVHISGLFVISIALAVYTSGSFLNVFNVHLNQIDRNQHAAAEMLGLKGWKKYRYVILPQAVKPMLPLIGAESKVLLRATTYAGYISELDIVKVTEIIRNQTYDILVPLLLVSIVFLILSHIIVESISAIYNKAFKYD